MKCPVCDNGTMTLKPKPGNPNRVRGFCPCNPAGPVLEMNAPKRKRRKKTEEVLDNGNTE